MKANGGRKSAKKPAQKKGKIEEWFINVLAIVLPGGELSSKQDVRFAIDPVKKRKVDKSSAVVGLHSKRNRKVLYFESNEAFNRYLKTPDE